MRQPSDTAAAIYPAPKVLDRMQLVGRDLAFVVEAPFGMNRDRPEILGMTVLIGWEGEGALYTVTGVERHMPATPIREGERIALYVKPIQT